MGSSRLSTNPKLVVVGAGAFGTALAVNYAIAGRDVTLLGRSTASWETSRKNPRLPDVKVPTTVKVVRHIDIKSDHTVLFCQPAQTLGPFLEDLGNAPAAFILCSKGIDQQKRKTLSQLYAAAMSDKAAVFTGPAFASDIAQELPTAVTLATKREDGEALQKLLSTPSIRPYLSDDPVGAELGGALKNVVAIGCGICAGAGLGESARSALATRGHREMKRLAVALGGQAETLDGLCGFGDLMLTCASQKSRNYAFGFEVGRANQMLASKRTVEGIATAAAVARMADHHRVEMPIAKAVAGILSSSQSVRLAMRSLLSRKLGRE